MDPKTRSLIELLRDETQSRSVFDRCNEVLAAADAPKPPRYTSEGTIDQRFVTEYIRRCRPITDFYFVDEAEVEIITGERR